MKTSKSGLQLRYVAALSFVLIFLGHPLVSILLVGAALYLEKDEWLTRQTLQAFFLSLFMELIDSVLLPSSFYGFNFSYYDSYDYSYFSGGEILRIVLSCALAIAILIFVILAITRTIKEHDAGIPFLSGLTYRMFGLTKPAYMPPMPPQGSYYYPPQPPYIGQNPQAPQAQPPQAQAPQQPGNPAPQPQAENPESHE